MAEADNNNRDSVVTPKTEKPAHTSEENCPACAIVHQVAALMQENPQRAVQGEHTEYDKLCTDLFWWQFDADSPLQLMQQAGIELTPTNVVSATIRVVASMFAAEKVRLTGKLAEPAAPSFESVLRDLMRPKNLN